MYRLCSVLVVCCAIDATASGQDANLKTEILESIREYAALLDVADGVVNYSDFELTDDDGEVGKTQGECRFVYSGGSEQTVFDSNFGSGTHGGRVLNPDYSATVEREAKEFPFTVASVESANRFDFQRQTPRSEMYVFAGICAGVFSHIDLRRLLSDPGVRLSDVQRSENERQEPTVEFSFESGDRLDRLKNIRSGRLWMVKKSHWLVSDAELNWMASGEPPAVFVSHVEFAEDESGVTVPRFIREERRIGSSGRSEPSRRFVALREFRLTPQTDLPAETFRLSAFGLPEPALEPESRPASVYLMLAGIGALLTITAWILKNRTSLPE